MRTLWTLPRAIALTVLLGTAVVARVPGFPGGLAAAVALVAVARIVLGGDGGALLRRRWRVLLQGLAAVVAVFLLGRLAGSTSTPLALLLEMLALLQVLLLVAPLAPFPSFLALLLSTVDVAGAGFLRPDLVGLAGTVAWLSWLIYVLVLFERRAADAVPERTRGVLQRLRAGTPGRLPRGAGWRAVTGLSGLGFAIGLLLYVAAPRGFGGDGRADDAAAADLAPAEGPEAEAASAATSREAFVTGAGLSRKGIRLGDVGRIKKDLTPYFEVWLPPGREVWLREDTADVYRGGGWLPSEPLQDADLEVLRPGAGGFFDLGREEDPVRGYDLRMEVRKGPQVRLYLARDPVRVRLLRGGRSLLTVLRRQPNEQVESFVAMQEGDVVEQRVVPPVEDHDALASARSDAGVAPSPATLDLPASCRPIVPLAGQVVGAETNPWRRARRLVTWLRSRAFTYTLTMPEVDTEHPEVDFLLRQRRGHCEYFASSLALLLRALGHPARIVRGFRGGDWQKQRQSWLVRGSHYHAWTEMYFEGLGWIPLDATPPDYEAVDAETFTREAYDRSAFAAPAPLLERFLAYGAEERRALARALAEGVRRFVVAPLRFAFGRDGRFLGVPFLLGLVLLLRRGRRRRERRRAAGSTRGAGPVGPYGDALLLLARRGLRRRPQATAREFATDVARRLPEAEEAFDALTRRYEEERFGGRVPDAGTGARDRAHLATLAAAARQKRARA